MQHLLFHHAAHHLATSSEQSDALGSCICPEILVQGLLGGTAIDCPERPSVPIWLQDDWQQNNRRCSGQGRLFLLFNVSNLETAMLDYSDNRITESSHVDYYRLNSTILISAGSSTGVKLVKIKQYSLKNMKE